jgi:hypothetical protein
MFRKSFTGAENQGVGKNGGIWRMKYEKREEARFIFGMQSAFNKGQMKLKRFPQAKFGHPTLTEKIHSDRIAASEGPECSMVKSHD